MLTRRGLSRVAVALLPIAAGVPMQLASYPTLARKTSRGLFVDDIDDLVNMTLAGLRKQTFVDCAKRLEAYEHGALL